jgi:hypothetical protein
MTLRPQIVVRYNDTVVENRFLGERDLLIEWVSSFVWDNYRGIGFDLSIEYHPGVLLDEEWVRTENLENSGALVDAVRHKFRAYPEAA